MLRPDSRIRILSLAVGATAVVAAVGLAVGTPSDLDPLGSLGRADAAAPEPAPAGAPRAFGVEGLDLAAFGYSGPDLAATSIEQLSAPMPKLPTEQAAAARDRLAVAAPHVEGLHQAKNLLRKATAKHDHHLYAAKVAVAEAEQARVDAEARLAGPGAEVTRPPADAPGDDRVEREPDAADGAALAVDRHEVENRPPDAAEPEERRSGKGTGGRRTGGKGTENTPAGKAAGKETAEDAAEPASPEAPPALPEEPSVVAAVVDEVVEQLTSPAEDATSSEPADRPADDSAENRATGAPDPADVATARRIERLAAQVADARATAARHWEELERRRERRRELSAAAELAEQQLARFDAHVRWLDAVLDKAQARMLPAGAGLVERGRAGEVPIVEVRGFHVHAALADSLRQLVDAAATVGIDLEGRAYRPVSRQIELRRQNCGTSDYDVYEKPSSLCSPPTAIPGRSLHELGLAVDFMNGENSITSRRDPAFRWLAANAPAYGFHNLPAEPWHWSVTAQ